MRLTLRTLLAYLDEILDAEDAKQLQRKIEDSEFATSLMHQIRGSVKRLRLDAPALDAQGTGGDLNSVSEYLDNVLPPEQVPALEKACLDNDVNLGEVASCHQILTLVLGEPADVSDSLRQRAYAIAPTVAPDLDPERTELASNPTERTPASERVSSGPAIGVSSAVRTPADSEPADENVPAALPSTKEAWRADAKENPISNDDPQQTDSPAAVAVVPTSKSLPHGKSTDTTRQDIVEKHENLPAYMDRKNSGLRSALVTGIVALLLLAALFLATNPMDASLLSGWFGKSTHVAQHQPVEPTEAEFTQVPTEASQAGPSIDPPAFPASSESNETQARWHDAPAFPPTTPEEEMPESDSEQGLATRFQTTGNQTGDASIPGLHAMVSESSSRDAQPVGFVDPLPVVEPEIASPASRDGSVAAPLDPIASALPEVNVSDDPLTHDLPARREAADTLPDVPREPAPAVDRTAPSDLAVPLVDSAPLVDSSVDESVELASISPPVASPTPSVSNDETQSVSQLPVETSTLEAEPITTLRPTKIGRNNQALLTYELESESWVLADDRSPLALGSTLQCLPACRADLEIGDKIKCTLVDATRVQLGPEDYVSIIDGRILVESSANASQKFEFNGKVFSISSKEDAVVAIEANKTHVPGAELDELPHTLLRIYPVKATANIAISSQNHQVADSRTLLVLDDFTPKVVAMELIPEWATSSAISPADAGVLREWNRDSKDFETVEQWLRGMLKKRKHFRGLAARCLAELDDYAPIIKALNDSDQRTYWEAHFATLRKALTRPAESVSKLQLEFEKLYGENASLYLELIRGYSGTQLGDGGATKLVDLLSSESLDLRVLAFQNLVLITGAKQYYGPSQTEAKRRGPIRQWKKRLQQGNITYKETSEVKRLLRQFTEEQAASQAG